MERTTAVLIPVNVEKQMMNVIVIIALITKARFLEFKYSRFE